MSASEQQEVGRGGLTQAQMEATEDILYQSVRRGLPWSKSLEDTLYQARPGQVLFLLKGLRVRTCFYQTPPLLDFHTNKLADYGKLLGRWLSDQPWDFCISPYDFYNKIKEQWHYLTHALEFSARQRLQHIWQVQAQPLPLRQEFRDWAGLTFFSVKQAQREEFTPLEELRVLVLTYRQHYDSKRDRNEIMVDLKVYRSVLDHNTVYFGGDEIDSNGAIKSRCTLIKYFSYTPFPGAYGCVLNSALQQVYQEGLQLHAFMEEQFIQGQAQQQPLLPRCYYGFAEPYQAEAVPVTPYLEGVAKQAIDNYIRAGKPTEYVSLPSIVSVREQLTEPAPSWAAYRSQLSPEQVRQLLRDALVGEQLPFNKLYLLPTACFQSKPEQSVVTTLARLRPELHYQLTRADSLLGAASNVEYDLTSVPPTLEDYYK